MKYPNGIIKTSTKVVVNGNRGMQLESDINITNAYYLEREIACIYKKPTPIKVVNVNYDKMMIKEAYFEAPSTTDYNGIYKGHYIDFEAKETKSKASFPLNNIHPHQIEHLKIIIQMGGVGFIIVRFSTLNETYLLEANKLFNVIENNKSIAISYFKEYGYLIKEKIHPRLDYLKIIDNILEGDNHEKIV
jgi:recombination protein U